MVHQDLYHGAVILKHNSIAELLLQQAAIDVNYQSSGGSTALHCCVISDNIEGLRLLLAHPGVSLNVRGKWGVISGCTPLMMAVLEGRINCIRELVREEGIDLETTDDRQRTLEQVAR